MNQSKRMSILSRYFLKRTNQHIGRVKDFCENIAEYFPIYQDDIIKRGQMHDKSKFIAPEYQPYLFITWEYKCKGENKPFTISEEMRGKMRQASYTHCQKNPHHPEFWDKSLTVNPISEKDRDKPSGIIVDATSMDDLSLMEMVADWSSMSVEYDESSGPYKWADNNINKRWKFNTQQSELIYEIIECLWGKRDK